MSKNLTRKGLALGAVVALGASLFAGTPAQATGESITLTSRVGTSLKTVLGSTFDLKSTFVGWSAAPTLKYWITGVAAADLVTPQVRKSTAGTGNFQNVTTAAADKTTPTGVVVDFASSSYSEALANAHDLRLGLNTANITATTSITVTAFDDSVEADGKITAGEVASAPVTVTFVKSSEVTATTTIDPITLGTTSAKVKVTLGDINLAQVTTGVVRVAITQNGSLGSQYGLSWNSDDSVFEKTITGLSTFTDTTVLTAQAYVLKTGGTIQNDATDNTQYISTGSSVAAATPAAAAYEVEIGALKPDTASAVNVSASVIRAKYTSAINLRSLVKVVPTAAAKYVLAGIPAKVEVKETSAGSLGTTTLSFAGKTLKKDGTAVTIDTTTDAAGYVNLAITADKAVSAEAFTVTVSVLDKSTGGYLAGTPVNYTFETAVEKKYFATYTGSGAELSAVKGGNISFDLAIYDQFGQLFNGDGFKAEVTSDGNTTSGAVLSGVSTFTGGKATVSLTDNSTAAGLVQLDVVLKKYNKTADTWGTSLENSLSSTAVENVKVNVVASNTVKTLTATNTDGTKAIAYLDFINADHRAGDANIVLTDASTLTGLALGTNGEILKGVAVTVAAEGVQFASSLFGVYKVGSITVYTNSSGQYEVKYLSHKAGKPSLVVTSGSATKTVTGSDFAFPASYTKATGVVISAPASIKDGYTATYSVTVVDDYGNAVKDTTAKVDVSYAGPGYITTDLAAATDVAADGTLTFRLVTALGETGNAVLTVRSYGADNNSTADNANRVDDAVVSKTIVVGAAPVVVVATKAYVVGKTKSFTVSVSGNASAKNVVVKVAGKTVATLKGSKSAKTYTVKATKGSKKVTVYVGGKLIATKTVSVK